MYITKDFERTQTRKFNPIVYINEKEIADQKERERQYQEFIVREKKKSKKGKK